MGDAELFAKDFFGDELVQLRTAKKRKWKMAISQRVSCGEREEQVRFVRMGQVCLYGVRGAVCAAVRGV